MKVSRNFFLNKKIIPGYSNVNTNNSKTYFDSDGYVQANIDKFDMPINDTAFLLKFYFQYNDPNQSTILSVTHQYGTLSLEKNSSYIKLMYNNEELYSYNTLTNSGDYNVGIVIKQTTMDFIVNGTSQGAITCPPLGFLSNVVLGNNSSYNDGYTDGIKYFSVAKSNVNVNSDINSALSHRYTIDLTTENFKKYVYQTGYAETYFLSSDTSEKRSSIQFLSNSSNAKVYASSYYSSGYPLVEVYNNQSIPHYDYDNHIYVKIKVELKSINNYDNPKVSNLNVYTYKDDLIYSVNSSSTITSNTNNSYEIGHSRPLFIKDNFGIKQRSGSSNNSIININNQDNIYQSISFMFRLDNSSFILSNKSLISVNGNEISLTFIGQNLWTLTPSSGTLYINGIKDATNITVGASNDRTGNIKYGGDWTMESDGQDIKPIYFNDDIKNYKFLNTIEWDMFVGVIANVPDNVEIKNIYEYKNIKFIEINKMHSTVFNIYNKSVYDKILQWSTNGIPESSNDQIDQYIKKKLNIKIITTYPFYFDCVNSEDS